MLRGFLMALAIYKGTVYDCSPENSIAKIESMELDPISPIPGQNSTLWVAYDLSKEVTGGFVNYTYSWNFIPFEPTTVDLCSQEECPLKPACYNSSGTSVFPDVTGYIEAKIEWFDQNVDPIWCVNVIYNV